MAEICKKQRAAACGSHVLFNDELLEERSNQAGMGLSQQGVNRQGETKTISIFLDTKTIRVCQILRGVTTTSVNLH